MAGWVAATDRELAECAGAGTDADPGCVEALGRMMTAARELFLFYVEFDDERLNLFLYSRIPRMNREYDLLLGLGCGAGFADPPTSSQGSACLEASMELRSEWRLLADGLPG